jgi:Ca2+-transporting ATPase
MALSVLVVIEMLNAMNALSEDGSLLTMPPWCNKWLLVAIVVSLGLHMVIMYVPALAVLLEITSLDVKVRAVTFCVALDLRWWVLFARVGRCPVCVCVCSCCP